MVTTEIKPINTEYKGYKFRSRLEARWAVFFDSIGTSWEYETEGYEFADGTRYLPDFSLSSKEIGTYFIEIKPNHAKVEEIHKASQLAKNFETVVMIMVGDPYESFMNSVKQSASISIDQYGHILPVEGFFFLVCAGLITPLKYIDLVNQARKDGDLKKCFEVVKDEIAKCFTGVKKARAARFEFGEA